MLSCSLLAKVHKITVKIINLSQNYFLQDCIKTNIFVHQILNDMKRQFTFLALSAACILASQSIMADVIVLADGTSKQCYNVEAAKKWIYYTETDAEDAPVQRIAIDEVFAYKIGDGKMQMIGNEELETKKATVVNTEASSGPVLAEAKPSGNNSSIIEKYNKSAIATRLKPKDKIYGGKVATIWGITEESIMDDDNIRVSFEENTVDYVFGYRIRLENKTDKPLYVDLANSFLVDKTGKAQPFFTNSIYTTSQSGSTGIGVNIGMGIGVGASASTGTSVTKAEQSILVIPPKSAVLMPGNKETTKSGVVEYPIVFFFIQEGTQGGTGGMTIDYQRDYINSLFQNEKATYDDIRYSAEELGVKENAILEIPESKSPKIEKFIITYSPSQDFRTYYQLPIGVYLRGIFGKNQGQNLKGELRYEREDPNSPIIIGVGHLHKKSNSNTGRSRRGGIGSQLMGF